MKIKIIKYKAKDGNIREDQYVSEDGKGYLVHIKNRKKPRHVNWDDVISEGDE